MVAVWPAAATALDCPAMPQQASRDAEVEVRVGVRLLGNAAGRELEGRTRQLTTDMLGRLPGADRVYLEQMLFASYCSALRDNTALTEAEREKRVLTYRNEMRRTLATGHEAARKTADPHDKARAELNRLGVDYSVWTFFRTIEANEVEKVRLFIAAGIDLTARYDNHPYGLRPFELAAKLNRPAIIDLLLKASAPPFDALSYMAEHGNLQHMQRLLALRRPSQSLKKALESAIIYGQIDAAELLLKNGATLRDVPPDIADAQTFYTTPENAERAVNWLHRHGFSVDIATGDKKSTPLMRASFACDIPMMRALLQVGAKVNSQDASGDTPLMLSMQSTGNGTCINDKEGQRVRLLLGAGADPRAINAQGDSTLHVAVCSDPNELLLTSMMLELGVPADLANNEGVTPLMAATRQGCNSSSKVLQALLAHGAKPDARDSNGLTPLMLAAAAGWTSGIDTLLDAQASIDLRSKNGETALLFAVSQERLNTVRRLLARKANAELPDRDGIAPIDYARKITNQELREKISRLLNNAITRKQQAND
jgi:ankyrin repeat protein